MELALFANTFDVLGRLLAVIGNRDQAVGGHLKRFITLNAVFRFLVGLKREKINIRFKQE